MGMDDFSVQGSESFTILPPLIEPHSNVRLCVLSDNERLSNMDERYKLGIIEILKTTFHYGQRYFNFVDEDTNEYTNSQAIRKRVDMDIKHSVIKLIHRNEKVNWERDVREVYTRNGMSLREGDTT